MRKIFIAMLSLFLLHAASMKAEGEQQLTINGELVEKVVTQITFEDNLVVLHFGEQDVQKVPMETVVLSFPKTTSINDFSVFTMKNAIDGSLSLSGLEAGTEVFIYDAAGKQVKHAAASVVDVRSLKAGVYVLKANNNIVKFVKR